MTEVIKFGMKAVVSSTACGAAMGAIAWGTRYVSQIPTVEVGPVAISGSMMTGISIISNKVLSYCTLNKIIFELIKPIKKPVDTGYGGRECTAQHRANDIVSAIGTTFGFLVSTVAVPTFASLMGGNISFGTAALFNLLNAIPTYMLTKHFNPDYDYSK